MKNIEAKLIGETVVVEIIVAICDICGSNCMKTIGENKIFEGMELKADWGYLSKKDGEKWRAVICESCVDSHFTQLIHFKIVK